MKSLVTSTLAILAIFALSAIHELACASTGSSAPSRVKQSAFVCDMDALNPEQRKRHFEVLGPALRAKRTGVRELAGGYEIEFPSDSETYQQLAEWVDGERACCPFFDIGIRVVAEGGPLKLRLTGRPGTKAFIQVDAAGWIKL